MFNANKNSLELSEAEAKLINVQSHVEKQGIKA